MSEEKRTVWVVSGGFDYEGLAPPLAVFESERTAAEFVNEKCGKRDNSEYDGFDSYHINETEFLS